MIRNTQLQSEQRTTEHTVFQEASRFGQVRGIVPPANIFVLGDNTGQNATMQVNRNTFYDFQF